MMEAQKFKRDATATKSRILAGAQQAFSTMNYGDAGIREIGVMAGTSSTLLLRYFGSKLNLFEAALTAAIPIPDMMTRPRADFGRVMAAAMLKPGKHIVAEEMIARSLGHADASAVAAKVIETCGIQPLAEWLGEPHGRARAMQIGMLANGVTTYMKQLPLPAVSTEERTGIERWFAEQVQALVDG